MAFPAAPEAKYRHVYNQFTIRAQRRDELQAALKTAGVPTEIYYPLCLHLQKAFSYLGYAPGSMPEAERASREALSLPVYPELTDERQERVVSAIAEFYR